MRSPSHRSVIVVVNAFAFQRFAQFVWQRVVGGISAGNECYHDGFRRHLTWLPCAELGMHHVVVNIISPSGRALIGSPFSRMLEISMMPSGSASYPFGEFLRSATCSAAEPVCDIECRAASMLAAKQQDDVVKPGLVDLGDGFCALILL